MPTAAELLDAVAAGDPGVLGASSLWRVDDGTTDRDALWHADPNCQELPRDRCEVPVALAGAGSDPARNRCHISAGCRAGFSTLTARQAAARAVVEAALLAERLASYSAGATVTSKRGLTVPGHALLSSTRSCLQQLDECGDAELFAISTLTASRLRAALERSRPRLERVATLEVIAAAGSVGDDAGLGRGPSELAAAHDEDPAGATPMYRMLVAGWLELEAARECPRLRVSHLSLVTTGAVLCEALFQHAYTGEVEVPFAMGCALLSLRQPPRLVCEPSDPFAYRLVCDLLSNRVPRTAEEAALMLDAVDAVSDKGSALTR